MRSGALRNCLRRIIARPRLVDWLLVGLFAASGIGLFVKFQWLDRIDCASWFWALCPAGKVFEEILKGALAGVPLYFITAKLPRIQRRSEIRQYLRPRLKSAQGECLLIVESVLDAITVGKNRGTGLLLHETDEQTRQRIRIAFESTVNRPGYSYLKLSGGGKATLFQHLHIAAQKVRDVTDSLVAVGANRDDSSLCFACNRLTEALAFTRLHDKRNVYFLGLDWDSEVDAHRAASVLGLHDSDVLVDLCSRARALSAFIADDKTTT